MQPGIYWVKPREDSSWDTAWVDEDGTVAFFGTEVEMDLKDMYAFCTDMVKFPGPNFQHVRYRDENPPPDTKVAGQEEGGCDHSWILNSWPNGHADGEHCAWCGAQRMKDPPDTPVAGSEAQS